MQAVTFEGVGAVAYRTVADPVLTGADEALVRMEAAGLCGSDLHVYRGREPGPDPGTPLGHELAGTVVEVGAAVQRFRPGERVVAPFSTACGDCFYCRHELPARCERGALFGFVSDGAGLAGCQAELVRVPLADASLVAVPSTVPSELAVLAGDVLATGW
ncbi:MAG: alcohol dehydrogenase catalytic domain-containing protein, partial [Holophagae bacterium]|nr:alcohol dehydrogenase catalytic domain-containing protein [Holophagae bacterium]